MVTDLRIARDLVRPAAAVTRTFAILAMRGRQGRAQTVACSPGSRRCIAFSDPLHDVQKTCTPQGGGLIGWIMAEGERDSWDDWFDRRGARAAPDTVRRQQPLIPRAVPRSAAPAGHGSAGRAAPRAAGSRAGTPGARLTAGSDRCRRCRRWASASGCSRDRSHISHLLLGRRSRSIGGPRSRPGK